jgi:hypothetical protein
MKTFIQVCWTGVLVFLTVSLSSSPVLSAHPFIRLMEINLILMGVTAFIYGLVAGFSRRGDNRSLNDI